MIRKEHARTLSMLRGEYHERLRLITTKRNAFSANSPPPRPALVASPPVMSPTPPVAPQPPSRPIAVVSANVNPKIRPRVGRQRSLQQGGRVADKRRRTKSEVMGMRASPPMPEEVPIPPQQPQQQPTVFNMMSRHMTVNMLAHPNQGFMSPTGHDLSKAGKAMLFGSQPAPHLHHNPNVYSFPNQQNNNNHAYNAMAPDSHMNGMTNFYTMQSHSGMTPNCQPREEGPFPGPNEGDKFYQVPPDPTDPNLGKRMLRNLLMGEKQANNLAAGQCKPNTVYHPGTNPVPRMPGDPMMVHQPSVSFRDMTDAQRLHLKPQYHQPMSQSPHHLLLQQQQQHQQQHQQAVMSSGSQHQQHPQNLGLCNPPPFIEEPPLNLDETLSKEIMQLDDQMLQASMDVAGLLPDQWENIQLTDEDYL